MRWSGTRKVTAVIVAGALLALAASAGVRYARLYTDLREGRNSLIAAADLMEEKGLAISERDLEQAEGWFQTAGDNLEAASRTLGSDPLVAVAGGLPWLGIQVEGGRALVDMGVEASAAGLEAVEAARAYREVRDGRPGALSQRVVPVLEAVEPAVTGVEARLTVVRERRADLAEGGLIGPLRSGLDQLDERLRELEAAVADYRRALRMAPRVLGYEGPQTYLVLAHDNTEILATGGFILVYGFLTMDQGKVEELVLDNVVNIHPDWPPATGDYIDPPRPLATYLLRGWPMGLAEASWWPDFPTAARNAIEIYRTNSGNPRPIDGVIGVNFLTLERLLEVIGPVTVPEYGVTVNAENVTETTLVMTHPEGTRPWESDRYDFVGYLAQDVLDDVLDAESGQWPALLDAIRALGREKNLLLYHTDPGVQEAIADLGWDGGIRPTDGDYLMVVDSSVASTKLNLVVEPRITLDVSIEAAGIVSHQATITYSNEHSAWATGKDARLVGIVTGDGSLPQYGNYVRLVAPIGASIRRVVEDGVEVGAEDVWSENGRAVFGRFTAVPLDAQRELSFTYSTRSAVAASPNPYTYRLLIQKQPGTRATPLRVVVHPPAGLAIVSTELDGREIDGRPGEITTDLRTDHEIVVRYAPGH